MMIRRALKLQGTVRVLKSKNAVRMWRPTCGIQPTFRPLTTVPLRSFSSSNASDPSPSVDKHEFQAETRQLLDIVTNSIYTDKEVFIRELISNASDALEKVRHLQAIGESIVDPEVKSEIQITTDEENNTLTISDSGVGMTKEEMIQNLGTIARSGSKAFLDQIKENAPTDATSAATGIIGKFGVGFYSAFMVADKIDVYSRSARSGDETHLWRSDGTGSYEIASADHEQRGCKIVIHLKESCKEYASPRRIESIIRQYSNFVAFPIVLNGEPVNTIEALWTMDPSEVTDDKYTEFYRFIANAFDEPMYRLSFRADAPIELKTLFFIGTSHMEKHGYARLEPGVSLYSRKVLIERNSKDILPDWLRFVKGVVDSEDLPLSLSRESMQDTRILAKIKDVLTRRILRYLDEKSRKEPESFEAFFKEFGSFLKEGVCTDFQHKDTIAKLLRYESSSMDAGTTTTLDDYISRLTPEQEEIYYLCAPSRELAQASPYYEAFKKNGLEVLFVYSPIDDFVMNNIGEFNKRKVVSAENANVEVNAAEDETTGASKDAPVQSLSSEDADLFAAWMKLQLQDKVKDVKTTNRLSDSPALITEHESASVRKMMAMVNDPQHAAAKSPKNVLSINPKHPIIVHLNQLKTTDAELAATVAQQIYDNASMAAGLMDDGRQMLPRLNQLLEKLVDHGLRNAKTED